MRRLFALLLIATAGCSAAPPFLDDDRRERVERRLLELEREATRSRLEIERLQRRLAELEAEAGTAPAAASAPAPTPARRLEEPASRPLAEAIEESELADNLPPPTPAGSDVSYEGALRMLRDGRTAEAESALLAFAAAEPTSDLADNAWFWIGESRLVRGDVDGALAAYRTTIDRYPEGNKVPDAMLKLGHALALSGQTATAREAWAELIRRFPQTAAAEAARERLAGR
jgi:tol-pal system protein YbgF